MGRIGDRVLQGEKGSSVSASTARGGARTAAAAAGSSLSHHFRRNCSSGGSRDTRERPAAGRRDLAFFLLLIPVAAISLPSLAYCGLELILRAHGALAGGTLEFHLPPENLWDALFSWQTAVYAWVSEWNWLATLAATGFLAVTLARPRWRHLAALALIPYGVLLCADFTLRWRSILLP